MQRHPNVEVPHARAFMNTHVLSFTPDVDIEEAVSTLIKTGFSGAPVIDAAGALVGVLSELDCLRVLSAALYEGWPEGTVGDHMSGEVESIGLETDLFGLVGKFRGGQHRRFPVVDEAGRLVGLVTRRDLLRALDHFRAHQPGPRPESTYAAIERRRRELG